MKVIQLHYYTFLQVIIDHSIYHPVVFFYSHNKTQRENCSCLASQTDICIELSDIQGFKLLLSGLSSYRFDQNFY